MQINCYSLCGNGFISREKNAISFDDRPEYLKVGRGSEKNIIVSNQCFLNMCRKVGVRAISPLAMKPILVKVYIIYDQIHVL